MRRVAVIGGGVGLTAAYELARLARDGDEVQAVLLRLPLAWVESSRRCAREARSSNVDPMRG